MVTRIFRSVLFSGLLVAASSPAHAQPTPASQGAFTGATVIDFNSIGNEVGIVHQYNGLGVTFCCQLYGMTNPGDLSQFPGNGGGVIASNWLYSQNAYLGLSFGAQFASPASMVGFYLENWPTQTATVQIWAGTISLGIINFAPTSSLQAQFFGLQSNIAFDSLVFRNTATNNGFFAIDDFQFVTAAVTTPEPASLALLATGLVGVFGLTRRRGSAWGRVRSSAAPSDVGTGDNGKEFVGNVRGRSGVGSGANFSPFH